MRWNHITHRYGSKYSINIDQHQRKVWGAAWKCSASVFQPTYYEHLAHFPHSWNVLHSCYKCQRNNSTYVADLTHWNSPICILETFRFSLLPAGRLFLVILSHFRRKTKVRARLFSLSGSHDSFWNMSDLTLQGWRKRLLFGPTRRRRVKDKGQRPPWRIFPISRHPAHAGTCWGSKLSWISVWRLFQPGGHMTEPGSSFP